MKDTRKRQAVLARRRRRFRYRRLHALRLDVAAVVFLFVAGWLLCPSFTSEKPSGDVDTPMTSAIIEQVQTPADVLVLSPTVFAFTSAGGFADGVVAAGLAASTEKLAVLPPLPEPAKTEVWLHDRLHYLWPGGSALWQLSMPTIPSRLKESERVDGGNSSVGVKTWVSTPGIEVPEGLAADLKSGRGKTVRIYVVFGDDGRAENVMLGQNTLESVDVAAVERRAMRMTGSPGLFAWITLSIP